MIYYIWGTVYYDMINKELSYSILLVLFIGSSVDLGYIGNKMFSFII